MTSSSHAAGDSPHMVNRRNLKYVLLGDCEREGFSLQDEQASNALIVWAEHCAYSPDGDLHFVQPFNHVIKRLRNGILSTVVGSGLVGIPGAKMNVSMDYPGGLRSTARTRAR